MKSPLNLDLTFKCGVAQIIKTQRQILGFKVKIRTAKESTTRDLLPLPNLQTERARFCLHGSSDFTLH